MSDLLAVQNLRDGEVPRLGDVLALLGKRRLSVRPRPNCAECHGRGRVKRTYSVSIVKGGKCSPELRTEECLCNCVLRRVHAWEDRGGDRPASKAEPSKASTVSRVGTLEQRIERIVKEVRAAQQVLQTLQRGREVALREPEIALAQAKNDLVEIEQEETAQKELLRRALECQELLLGDVTRAAELLARAKKAAATAKEEVATQERELEQFQTRYAPERERLVEAERNVQQAARTNRHRICVQEKRISDLCNRLSAVESDLAAARENVSE